MAAAQDANPGQGTADFHLRQLQAGGAYARGTPILENGTGVVGSSALGDSRRSARRFACRSSPIRVTLSSPDCAITTCHHKGRLGLITPLCRADRHSKGSRKIRSREFLGTVLQKRGFRAPSSVPGLSGRSHLMPLTMDFFWLPRRCRVPSGQPLWARNVAVLASSGQSNCPRGVARLMETENACSKDTCGAAKPDHCR